MQPILQTDSPTEPSPTPTALSQGKFEKVFFTDNNNNIFDADAVLVGSVI